MLLHYLSHPQVLIDPDVAVPQWGLSDIGKERAELFAQSALMRNVRAVFSSDETKAMETADAVCAPHGLTYQIREDMHENDRSATGFVPPDVFELLANQFFAEPDQSVRGWERAIDAQARIVAAVEKAAEQAIDGDLLIVGHGGVGTLLYCHFAGLSIDRKFDQKGGGGCYWSMDWSAQDVLHGWRPIEEAL